MNILVIGNGFDLAHGLPTKYGDFLFFCKILLKMAKNAEIENEIPKDDNTYEKWISMNKDNLAAKVFGIKIIDGDEWEIGKSDRDKNVYKDIVSFCERKFYAGKPNVVKNILYFAYDNIWIEYFLQCNMYQKENWIDFESEISKVIQSLDKDISIFDFENNTQSISNVFLNAKYYDANSQITYKQLRDKLLDDLNRLIRAFEIYLAEYVEKIDIKIISPDIKRIVTYKHEDSNALSNVISFNYTNIYEKVYLDKYSAVSAYYIDYIHGKVDINNTKESNNMVLGIDEYLPKKRRNKETKFIAFKKFYQRIYKGTGNKYKKWMDIIKRDTEEYQIELENARLEKNVMILKSQIRNLKEKYLNKHKLYIFGHSLDITDKDILRDLILNDNVYTTIFYVNKDVMGQQIANLVKVIGQDELIKRTGGSTKTIEFKQQQPMVPIDNQGAN